MNSKLLVEKYGFKQLSGIDQDVSIQGVFISDLLSWVMGHSQSQDAWITIQSHSNILAVALLRELACIIVAHDVTVDQSTIDKANQEDLVVLSTSLSAYEICKIFVSEGV